MNSVDGLIHGFQVALQWDNLMWCLIGVFLGLALQRFSKEIYAS